MSSISPASSLHWSQRPPAVQSSISDAFADLRRSHHSGWQAYNGSSCYKILEVNEQELFKQIILDNYPARKTFYYLDIGAAEFQSTQSLAHFIDEQADLPDDVHAHLIGVRGESFDGPERMTTRKCTLHHIGAFKVEELLKSFQERGFALSHEVDLILSHWCFRHLADPLGTLLQTYELMRPQTGYALVDGFYFFLQGESSPELFNMAYITHLLRLTRAPFLMRKFTSDPGRSFPCILMQKPDRKPLELDMRYEGTVDIGSRYQVGSEHVTRFIVRNPADWAHSPVQNDSEIVWGDHNLYRSLRNRGLLPFQMEWRAIDQPVAFPFHDLVNQKDPQLFKIVSFIREGHHIDSPNQKGETALLKSIKLGKSDLFHALLKAGANSNLPNSRGVSPLHLAAKMANGKAYMDALIARGAEIEAKNWYRKTPLDFALEGKHLDNAKALIAAGCTVSESQKEALSALENLDQKKPTTLGQIASWIKEGNCVVLHSHFQNGHVYYMGHESEVALAKARWISVDINPECNVLNHDEWLGVLNSEGCKEYVGPLAPLMFNPPNSFNRQLFSFGY